MKLSLLAVLILVFPLLFAIPDVNTYGYRFSSIYFLFIALLSWLSLIAVARDKTLSIPKRNFSELLVLLLLFAYSVLATDSLRYSKPSFFLAVLITIFLLSKIVNIRISSYPIKVTSILFLLLCFVYTFFASSYTYDGRYSAFLLAPTVLSVNADAFFILIYSVCKNTLTRLLLCVLFFGIVYLTQTRINLLATALIPVLFFVLERRKISRRLVIISFALTFVFVYPLYQFLMESGYFESFLMLRYSENRDASFDMRYYLHAVSLELFQNGTLLEKFFGHGSEYSRLHILELTKEDSYSHNDFLRLLIDFGIFFTAIYLTLIAKIASRNNVTAILLVLYLSSFYHNMVFDFFIPSLIILLSDQDGDKETGLSTPDQ